MLRAPTDIIAAQRAQWLEELTNALDEAEALVWRLDFSEIRLIDAFELLARLEGARAEARSLRLSRARDTAPSPDPEWINSPVWDAAQPKCCA